MGKILKNKGQIAVALLMITVEDFGENKDNAWYSFSKYSLLLN